MYIWSLGHSHGPGDCIRELWCGHGKYISCKDSERDPYLPLGRYWTLFGGWPTLLFYLPSPQLRLPHSFPILERVGDTNLNLFGLLILSSLDSSPCLRAKKLLAVDRTKPHPLKTAKDGAAIVF